MPPAANSHTRRSQKQTHYNRNKGESDSKLGQAGNPATTASNRLQKVRKPVTVTTSTLKDPPNLQSGTSNERLRKLPEKRAIPWRKDQEFKDVDPSKARPQQRSGLLLVTRGEVQLKPCKQCEAGNGRFEECVALRDYFLGACASCVFPSKGSQCSLRTSRKAGQNDTGDEHAEEQQEEEEESQVADVKDDPGATTTRKRKRKSTFKALENEIESRKRGIPARETKEQHAQKIVGQQVEPEPPLASDLLIGTAVKRNKDDRVISTSLSAPSRPPAPYNSNGVYSAHPYGLPTTPGQHRQEWAAANSKTIANAALQSSKRPTGSSFTSESASIMQPIHGATDMYRSSEVDREKERQVPMVDDFSKGQQMQVSELVHRFQDGIDHLNNQLGSLKALLGIDEDV